MTLPTVTITTEVTESGARSTVAELDEFLEFQTEKLESCSGCGAGPAQTYVIVRRIRDQLLDALDRAAVARAAEQVAETSVPTVRERRP